MEIPHVLEHKDIKSHNENENTSQAEMKNTAMYYFFPSPV